MSEDFDYSWMSRSGAWKTWLIGVSVVIGVPLLLSFLDFLVKSR